MIPIRILRNAAIAAVAAVLILMASPGASAQGVVSEWGSVKAPPAPVLKEVKIDPAKTALLVMDFNDGLCAASGKYAAPRCLQAIPKVKKLLDEARAHHMLVVFTGYPHMAPPVKALPRRKGEPKVVAGPDKFEHTDLNTILKNHGITTLIATGVVANGCVLYTTIGAALHGYKVIVPVDTMPGRSAYAEQSTIWHIANDIYTRKDATLTSSNKITF